jgi:hypothetical protein
MTEEHCWHNDNVSCVDCVDAKLIYFIVGNIYFNINFGSTKTGEKNKRAGPVEGLFCKRPIQCLASSKNIEPHPLTARRVCTPSPFGAGGGHTRWVERGWGVNSSEDARHCSVLHLCKYFVAGPLYADIIEG